MKFECPNCKKSGQVDDSKVPESGVYATCPQCSNKFLVKRGAPKNFEFERVVQPHDCDPSKKQNNSARISKGKKWAFVVFVSLLVPLVMRILFASGHTNPQEYIVSGIAGILGLMIITCPIAFAIGNFITKPSTHADQVRATHSIQSEENECIFLVGKSMRYFYAVIACFVVLILAVAIKGALGWGPNGGGAIPAVIVISAVIGTWYVITKQHSNKVWVSYFIGVLVVGIFGIVTATNISQIKGEALATPPAAVVEPYALVPLPAGYTLDPAANLKPFTGKLDPAPLTPKPEDKTANANTQLVAVNNSYSEQDKIACTKLIDERSAANSAKDWVQLEILSKHYIRSCGGVYDAEDLSSAYTDISMALLRMNKLEEALNNANKGINTHYSSPLCHFNKFSALFILGRKREAKEALRVTKSVTISELDRIDKGKAYISQPSEQELYAAKKRSYETLLYKRISEYNDTDFE